MCASRGRACRRRSCRAPRARRAASPRVSAVSASPMASSPRASGSAASRSAQPHSSVEQVDVLAPVGAQGEVLDRAQQPVVVAGRRRTASAADASSRLARSRSVLVTAMPATSSPSGAARTAGGSWSCSAAEALDRRRQVLGPALAAQHGPQVVVGAGRGQQVDRPVQVAARQGHARRGAGPRAARRRRGRRPGGRPTRGGRRTSPRRRRPPAGPAPSGRRCRRPVRARRRAAPGRRRRGRRPPPRRGGRRRSAPASTSSVRKSSTVSPDAGGAQLDQGRPAAEVVDLVDRDGSQGGEGGQVVVGERQVGLVQPLDPALRRQPGEGHGRLGAPAEHEVAVGRQGRGQRPPAGAAASPSPTSWTSSTTRHTWRGDRRHMASTRADDQGSDVGLAVVGDPVGHASDVGPEGAGEPGGQVPRVVVARAAPQPAVVATRGEGVLVDRLGEQRRLAEPRAGHDDGDRALPASLDAPEQVAAPDERTARPRRSVAVGPRHAAILRARSGSRDGQSSASGQTPGRPSAALR